MSFIRQVHNRIDVQNDPVNFVDPDGLLSAGQLGIGNPGSYGGTNTCESMYDDDRDSIERDPLIDPALIIGVGSGGVKLAMSAGKAVGSTITKEILLRRQLGADGAISKTHQVYKDGEIIHQHQDHAGKFGGSRRFNDKWTGTNTID